MSAVVERAARAIQIANAGEYMSDSVAEIAARAAITAMREPTDEMLFAAWDRAHEANPQDEYFRAVYADMIDAALAGTPSGGAA